MPLPAPGLPPLRAEEVGTTLALDLVPEPPEEPVEDGEAVDEEEELPGVSKNFPKEIGGKVRNLRVVDVLAGEVIERGRGQLVANDAEARVRCVRGGVL